MDILVEKNGRYEPKPIVLDRRTEGQKKVTTTKFVLLLFCLKKVSPVLLFLAGLVGLFKRKRIVFAGNPKPDVTRLTKKQQTVTPACCFLFIAFPLKSRVLPRLLLCRHQPYLIHARSGFLLRRSDFDGQNVLPVHLVRQIEIRRFHPSSIHRT